VFNRLSLKLIYTFTTVFFAAGLIFTSIWIEYQDKKQTEYLESKFDQYSSEAYIAFQQALTLEIERLNSLTAAFSLTDKLTQKEFESFAKILMTINPEIVALEWIEVISEDERLMFETEMKGYTNEYFEVKRKEGQDVVRRAVQEQYAVVKYVYPYEANKKAIGIDVYSDRIQQQALYAANTTQSPIATAPVFLVQENIHGQSVIAYQPVYDSKNKLKGYAALVLNLNQFIHYIKNKALLEPSLGFFLIDTDSIRVPFAISGPEYLVEEAMYRFYEFYLPFAGRNWVFNAEVNLKKLPDYQTFQNNSPSKQWAFGIVFSFLFALATFFILRARYLVLESNRSLVAQEKYYHNLIDHSSEAFILLNCDGDILDVNVQSCKLLGYSREALLAFNINQIDVKYSLRQLENICEDMALEQKLLFETRYKNKQGKVIPVEISSLKFMLDGEYVTGSFARDISDRITYREMSVDNELLLSEVNQGTAELSAQKRAFETLFDKSADGIFLSEGRHVIDCNQATVDMFGYKSKQQVLSLPNKVFAPEFQPDGERSHRKGFRMLQICLDKGSHHYEWVNRRANGDLFWTDVVLTRLEYLGRTVIHIAFRDINTRKQLESEMKTAREAAILASKSKSEFLAKMSHDIRTPLHGILSYAQMGESRIDSLAPEKIKRYFHNIQQSGQRLMSLLNDLLDSAKLESGLMTFNFQYQDIEPILDACLAEQAALIDQKKIHLEVKHPNYMAYFDSNRIAQVISNLISNAIRHTPYGELIVISIESIDAKSLVFSIQDSGKGINPSEFDSIFETFVQSKSEALNTGGSGLGLAISKEIITAHGGRIWADNWTSKNHVEGAVFRFTLPLFESTRK